MRPTIYLRSGLRNEAGDQWTDSVDQELLANRTNRPSYFF